MKKEPARTRSKPPSVPHQFEHVEPIVVHDPEEDMTALGKFVFHVIQDPKKYTGWALGIVAVVAAAIAITTVLTKERVGSSDVWAKVETAKKAEDRLEIAKEYPNSPATTWVLLQAASEMYNKAMDDMPNNRDVALPLFQKAIGLYEQIGQTAPKDSPAARDAALGKARSLEARNELPKAIEQYLLVVKNWPGSPQAVQAKQLADVLQTPEAAAFYKDLYAYSPTKVTLPPLGSEKIPLAPGGDMLPSTNLGPDFDASSILKMPIEPAPTKIREVKVDPPKVDPPKAATPNAATPTPAKPAVPGDAAAAKPPH